MPAPDAARTAIAACISAFATARSNRGVWQREAKLAAQLGGRPIDIDTAAAARRLGEWLRTQPAAPAQTATAPRSA